MAPTTAACAPRWATVLLGLDALAIDALERDGDAHRRWQLEAQRWRERLRGGGPLALVGDLCAAHGERLLALLDGERRISNYLQLAELLQEAQRQALGLHGLVDWLGRAIAGADANDEAQLLRLESDARRVQIVTLHKSKGLEYPLVFLPFVGIGSNDKSPGRHCSVHAGGARRLHWKFETLPEADWTSASTTWKVEQRAEDARLLYVGLTRAEHALWIASGDFFAADKAALAALLGDGDALQQAGVRVRCGAAAGDAAAPAAAVRCRGAAGARSVARALHNDWWVYSFSQLARAEAGGDTASAATLPAPGGQDEPESADDTAPADSLRPALRRQPLRRGPARGAGTCRLQQPGATGIRAQPAPADEARVIATALRGEGYGEDALDDGIALTTQLVGHTLHRGAAGRHPPVRRAGQRAPARDRIPVRPAAGAGGRAAGAAARARHRPRARPLRRAAAAGRPDDRPDRPDLPARRQVVRARLQVQPPARLRRRGAAARDGAQRVRPAGADLHAGAAPLAALPAGRGLRLRARLRRHPLPVLPRPRCRQRGVARHPRAALPARTGAGAGCAVRPDARRSSAA